MFLGSRVLQHLQFSTSTTALRIPCAGLEFKVAVKIMHIVLPTSNTLFISMVSVSDSYGFTCGELSVCLPPHEMKKYLIVFFLKLLCKYIFPYSSGLFSKNRLTVLQLRIS